MQSKQKSTYEETGRKQILIVEDDPPLGDLLLEVLQEEGAYQACHVLSGEMALATLQTEVPALLLLDYHLPGMNGLELADWLGKREEYDQVSILLMSSDMPQKVSGNSHLRTLEKPFELETLLHIVAELLA
jgi:DNA-binding response OmpR family regulator